MTRKKGTRGAAAHRLPCGCVAHRHVRERRESAAAVLRRVVRRLVHEEIAAVLRRPVESQRKRA